MNAKCHVNKFRCTHTGGAIRASLIYSQDCEKCAHLVTHAIKLGGMVFIVDKKRGESMH